jgi:hypothetical protein
LSAQYGFLLKLESENKAHKAAAPASFRNLYGSQRQRRDVLELIKMRDVPKTYVTDADQGFPQAKFLSVASYLLESPVKFHKETLRQTCRTCSLRFSNRLEEPQTSAHLRHNIKRPGLLEEANMRSGNASATIQNSLSVALARKQIEIRIGDYTVQASDCQADNTKGTATRLIKTRFVSLARQRRLNFYFPLPFARGW